METQTRAPSVFISKVSRTGFSSLLLGFVLTVAFVMLMTMDMSTPYIGTVMNTTDTVNITDSIYNRKNITFQINNISPSNQKVYVYLNYTSNSNHKTRMQVNSMVLKKKGSAEPTSLSDLKLLRQGTKKYYSQCSNLQCSTLLETIEASMKYNGVYIVMNLNEVDQSVVMNPNILIVYTSPNYTQFEAMWRGVLLVVMCTVSFIFLWYMRSYSFKNWTLEQKATGILLLSVTLFNNPLYSYEFLTAGLFLNAINAMSDTLLLCAVLLYVLIVFDALRKPLSQRKILTFYLPRFMIVLLMGSFIVNLYLYNVDNSDPLFKSIRDPFNITLAILSLLSSLVYLFCLLFAMIRSFSEARKLDKDIQERIKSYGTFTISAVFILGTLLLSNLIGGYKDNYAIYLTTIAYLNVYTIFLAIFYFPVIKNTHEWNERRREIVLDDVKVTDYDEEDNEMIIEDGENKDEAEQIALQGVKDELLKDDSKIDL